MAGLTYRGCQSLQIASLSASDLPQAPSDLMGHMAQGTGQLVQQPGPSAESSHVRGPTQNQQLLWSLSKQARVTHPNEEYTASKYLGTLWPSQVDT